MLDLIQPQPLPQAVVQVRQSIKRPALGVDAGGQGFARLFGRLARAVIHVRNAAVAQLSTSEAASWWPVSFMGISKLPWMRPCWSKSVEPGRISTISSMGPFN